MGLIVEHDLWHAQAQRLQSALDSGEFQTYIFDFMLAEVISALARRTHEKRRPTAFSKLVAGLKTRFPTKVVTWVYPDLPADYDDVLTAV